MVVETQEKILMQEFGKEHDKFKAATVRRALKADERAARALGVAYKKLTEELEYLKAANDNVSNIEAKEGFKGKQRELRRELAEVRRLVQEMKNHLAKIGSVLKENGLSMF